MGRWVVLLERSRLRWGGDLRRTYVLEPLAQRTGAARTGWGASDLRRALRTAGPGGPLARFRRWRPLVASSELLDERALDVLAAGGEGLLLDVHDEPLGQLRALGMAVEAERASALEHRFARNVASFRLLAAPSASFAELARLDPDRTLVVPNGTDSRHVRPGPLPDAPTVGMVSGASPARGIETLVEAVRLLREGRAEIRLVLWLVATGEASAAYLADLRERVAREPGIEIADATYDRLGEALAGATVLVVPHPPGPYFDAALPVKLFDSMAAGRPLVVTPRTEMAGVVTRCGAGLVAAGDRPEDLAAAIGALLDDPAAARRLAANGRNAAECEFDWQEIGGRLADDVLRRVEGEVK